MIEIKFRKINFDLVKLQHQLLIIFQKRGIWLIGDFIQNKNLEQGRQLLHTFDIDSS